MDLARLFDIPPVTRAFIGGSTILAIAVSTELVNEQDLTFVPSRIRDGEIWRLVTSAFYFESFNGAFLTMWALRRASSLWLELVYYGNTRAYAWRLTLITAVCYLASAYFGIRKPSVPIFATLEYISTRCNLADFLWFGAHVPTGLLPFHQLYLAWVLDDNPNFMAYATGIVLGQFIVFMDEVVPTWSQKRYLSLPGESLD